MVDEPSKNAVVASEKVGAIVFKKVVLSIL